jgi:probable HAF family extracellular repeat protein
MPTCLPSLRSVRAIGTVALVLSLSSLFSPAHADGFWQISDLGALGGGQFQNFGINAAGQVTGYSQILATSNYHAFRTAPNGAIGDPSADLGTLGGSQSFGYGINNSGQVTGDSDLTGNLVFHAFRTTTTGTLDDATATDFGTLGGSNSSGAAINALGMVAGTSDILGDTTNHAFRSSANGAGSVSLTDLGTLGGDNSSAWGINTAGQVVGDSEDSNFVPRAFLYTDGVGMQDLNGFLNPDDQNFWFLLSASGINDAGQIVGFGVLNGEAHAFLLTTTPEPGSIALLGSLGIAGAGFLRRRRRP